MNLNFLTNNLLFFCDSDSSCLDVPMGFCMEASGMTQGNAENPNHELEMEGGSVEGSTFKDEAESMEDDHDSEVRNNLTSP